MFLRHVSTAVKVSKTLPPRRLISSLHVTPQESTQHAVISILSRPDLAKEVQNIKFTTSLAPDQTIDQYTGEEDDAVLAPTYETAIRCLGQFPNLRHVGVEFSAVCSTDRIYRSGDAPESLEFRTSVLETLFTSLNDPLHPASCVTSLTLKNLQNVNDESLTSSPGFKSTLSRLRDLRLGIVTEYLPHSPESSYLKEELYTFFQQLPSVWLQPASSTLTTLKLWADIYWGYKPACNLRGVHFPKLKKLELYNWTITHDWQLEWILSHGDTLEELILQDCPIISHFRHTGLCDGEKYPVNPATDSSYIDDDQWQYTRRWYSFLSQLETRLPHLKVFRIGDWYEWRDTSHFDGQPWRSEGMQHPKRYVCFDGGVGPSPWVRFEDFAWGSFDGKAQFDPGLEEPAGESGERDGEAYKRLMGVVDGRGGNFRPR